MLLQEKADQVRPLLREAGLGCWLIFVRETGLHPDPGFELVVGALLLLNDHPRPHGQRDRPLSQRMSVPT
jgi:hypothetical protein